MLIKIKCHREDYTSAIVEAPSLEIARKRFEDIDGGAFAVSDEFTDRTWVLDDVEELNPEETDPDETTAFFNEELDQWDDEPIQDEPSDQEMMANFGTKWHDGL